MPRRWRTPSLVRLALVACSASAQRDLVAPGAMTRGGGGGQGGGGRRGGGWSTVSNWPVGIFVAGSSISALNGIYVKVENDNTLAHPGIMTWENADSGWLISNVDSRGYDALGHMPMEWLLIDEEGRERFALEGGAYLPGCCESWKHMHTLDRPNSDRGRLQGAPSPAPPSPW